MHHSSLALIKEPDLEVLRDIRVTTKFSLKIWPPFWPIRTLPLGMLVAGLNNVIENLSKTDQGDPSRRKGASQDSSKVLQTYHECLHFFSPTS